jgi:hypothetical protein
MVAVSTATGAVMLSGWAMVLLGASLLRAATPGRLRARRTAAAVTLAGLAVAVVARAAV